MVTAGVTIARRGAGSDEASERSAPGHENSKLPRRSPVGAPPGTLIADPNAAHSALSLTVMSPEQCHFYTDVSLADVEQACGQWPVIWLAWQVWRRDERQQRQR